MYVYGGWGLAPCGSSRPCLTHKADLWELDLNSMAWSEVATNREQPQPTARKGHSATLLNGSRMIVFGGSSWVPEPDADNSYGHTTRHVDDLWLIDLSGEEGHTWRAVHSVGDRPSAREGHAAVLVAGRYLVIHAGYGSATCAKCMHPPPSICRYLVIHAGYAYKLFISLHLPSSPHVHAGTSSSTAATRTRPATTTTRTCSTPPWSRWCGASPSIFRD